jgi:hypothetical protein
VHKSDNRKGDAPALHPLHPPRRNVLCNVPRSVLRGHGTLALPQAFVPTHPPASCCLLHTLCMPLLPHTLCILLALLSRLPALAQRRGEKAPLLERERAWVDSAIRAHNRRLHTHTKIASVSPSHHLNPQASHHLNPKPRSHPKLLPGSSCCSSRSVGITWTLHNNM